MARYLDLVNRFVWGVPTLILILGTGFYLSVLTGFAQIRLFHSALKQFFGKLGQKTGTEGTSQFRALCTALAATVGTGNLVGVAGAIAIGGPGSIFWMWICALLGMITKFAEATLAVCYRVKNGQELFAGSMYMIVSGLRKFWHPLAAVYSFFGIIAAFGVGNAVQTNAVISGINGIIASFGGNPTRQGDLLMGLCLAALVCSMLLGGANRIGRAAELMMPFLCCGYVLLCAGVLIRRADAIPVAFVQIFQGAFSTRAVTGGAIGSCFQALRVGVSRGVFTNEAGMGTASIAHGCARVDHPVEQGLMGIMEVFLDTIVICTLTALVILCSGVPIAYGTDAGAKLTFDAFHAVYGSWVSIFLGISLCCFAFATVLGWSFYGIRCAQFLFGGHIWKIFALGQTCVVFLSVLLKSGTIWSLAETVNGLMAIPNLIALVLLSPRLRQLTMEYQTVFRP